MRHCKGCSHPTICKTHGCAVDEVRRNEAAAAERVAVHRDAARYRWLEEHTVATGLSRWMGREQFLSVAVDKAMAADEPPNDKGKRAAEGGPLDPPVRL